MAESFGTDGSRNDVQRSEKPRINVGAWLAAFVLAVVIGFGVMGLVGSMLNGNGAPFLSSHK